jgi:hypothetical protein
MTGIALFGAVVAVVATSAVPVPCTADDAVDPARFEPGSDVVAAECVVELEQAAATATTAVATLATRRAQR